MKLNLTLLAFLLVGGTSIHGATNISQWTFETSPPANRNNNSESPDVPADGGTGVASGHHSSAATDWSTPAGNASANSLSANNWAIGDYWQFKVSTSGFEDIAVSWDQTRSPEGPAFYDLAYSLDGVSFTIVLDDFQVAAVTWSSGGNHKPASFFDPSLSGFPVLDDESHVYFRIVAASNASDSDGTSRIDNFTVSGTQIVTPPVAAPDAGGSLLLLSMALGGVIAVARRKA